MKQNLPLQIIGGNYGKITWMVQRLYIELALNPKSAILIAGMQDNQLRYFDENLIEFTKVKNGYEARLKSPALP